MFRAFSFQGFSFLGQGQPGRVREEPIEYRGQ
jgi:hypothetical protein